MSPETRQALLIAGFDLTAPRFERLPPVFEDRVHIIARVCPCNQALKIEQTVWVLIESKGRRFFAGQCSRCRVITWAPWINRAGVYTGPTKVVPPIAGV